MSILDNANAAATAAKNSISELQVEKRKLEDHRKTLTDERDALYRQPLNKSEVKQFIFDWIDLQAQCFIEGRDLKEMVHRVAFPQRNPATKGHYNLATEAITALDLEQGLNEENGHLNAQFFGFEMLPIFNGFKFSHGGKADLCFFFGDMIKEKIEARFDDIFPEGYEAKHTSMPLQEKLARIQEINELIAELDETIKELKRCLSIVSASAKSSGNIH